MTMTDATPNPAVIDDLVPRVKRWMRPKGWDRFPGWDNAAYDRMAEQVLTVMGAVGNPNTAEGIAVLTKVLAMIYAKNANDPSGEQIAEDMQHWTENLIIEVVNFEKVLKQHKKRMGVLNG